MPQVWSTGSSRGLGHAIVKAGLAAGNKVLATARDIKSLADLSERYGGQVKLFAMDVTDEAAAANAVMVAVDLWLNLPPANVFCSGLWSFNSCIVRVLTNVAP
jgi:NADP-dependent 3-hydroxy acid dehydrogenase YdfG